VPYDVWARLVTPETIVRPRDTVSTESNVISISPTLALSRRSGASWQP
jgi:hypothetical protein